LVGYAALTHPTMLDCFVASAPRNDGCEFPDSIFKHRLPTDTASHCRGALRPSFASIAALEEIEGAGKAGCALHPRSRVQWSGRGAHEHTGQRRHPDFPCAVVSTGLSRARPGDRAFLPPSSARSFASRELDTSVGVSGPHVFAVRNDSARQSPPSRPPHPTARS
jgi:hypothetical protein